MAMMTLATDMRPAKIKCASTTVTKSVAQAVDTARQHLRSGNPRAYARLLAGEHRAASARQQQALEAVIASDGQERLFVWHPANGCLLAKEC